MSKNTQSKKTHKGQISFKDMRDEILQDFEINVDRREARVIGRREVLTGKAIYGIFGDSKELAQLALAKCLKNGDIRTGYYRNKTLMFATGMSDIEKFFAQLYANPNVDKEPSSAGRMMNGHYATRWINEDGTWKNLMTQINSTSDISPTAGQMLRSLGIAYASKLYRDVPVLQEGFENFTDNGNEISIVTIGDASTSEGYFWETINAAGVMQVPLAVFVWDDGYGISVPKKYQTTKSSISKATAGFQYDQKLKSGVEIYEVKGHDYAALINTFEKGLKKVREEHIPAIFHVTEVTQPQGHSTSGSHERYKSKERLAWEKEFDCIIKLKELIISSEIANEEELKEIEKEAKSKARKAKQNAWNDFLQPIKDKIAQLNQIVTSVQNQDVQNEINTLNALTEPIRKDILRSAERMARNMSNEESIAIGLDSFIENEKAEAQDLFNSHLYSVSNKNIASIEAVDATYDDDAPLKNGFEVLNAYFDQLLASNPAVFAFGEDVGHIGDVNQAFAGLQEKHGVLRVSDTGIREATIIGQGIGTALRGLRPIAEIQYLDYLLYGLQALSDDVATLEYRTKGGQKCPVIVRTRGHRLEGIWHSGSPMGVIINSLRGMNICVPRNMTQAAGMYNTLLASDEPGLVIECLNGYRLKEKLPNNLDSLKVALGKPEIIREGEDITVVSYGSTLRVIEEAIELYLAPQGISVELVDVQTLLPFDTEHSIVKSLQKTSRIIFIDEDVPGGASAYMFQHVMEEQGGYMWLDARPRTLSAKAHRPAYATDGDYFSKPNAEDIAKEIENIMKE